MGSLLHLVTNSKPYLCLVASKLGSHVADPTEAQIIGGERALRYVKGRQDVGLILNSGRSNQLSAQTDSNWGSELN